MDINKELYTIHSTSGT